MASAMDSRLAYARLSAGRYGKPPTHSYQRLQQLLHHVLGHDRRVAIREVINGVMYILSTGCQWRALPKDLPPRSTVHDYLGLWNWDGTLDRIHHALYLKCREKAAREASPTACIIDSQSVKSAEKGGLASTATASMPAS